MIAMTVEGLGTLGLTRFQIDVGQADFFRGILEDLGSTSSARASCAPPRPQGRLRPGALVPGWPRPPR